MAADPYSSYFQWVSDRKEFFREIKFQGNFSQEELHYVWSVSKSKLYEMFRRHYVSTFHQFSDEQIEDGIKELENGTLKDVKDDDPITCNGVVLVTRFELE